MLLTRTNQLPHGCPSICYSIATPVVVGRACPEWQCSGQHPQGRAAGAGSRHPDPWQFILFEGEGRERLGTHWLMPPHAVARCGQCREVPRRATGCSPVIVVATRYQAHPAVPELEQEFSAGCALMAMQMAGPGPRGFNGIWRSGWFIFDRQIHGHWGWHRRIN